MSEGAPSSPNQLTIYTIPSRTEGPGRPQLERPYNQIVGVADSKGNVAWAQPGRTDAYSPDRVQRHDLASDPTHSGRVYDYWQTHYANEGPCPSGNCHDFAGHVASGQGDTRRPDHIISQGEQTVSLSLGEHAVVGSIDDSGNPNGHHSASGIGHGNDMALERLAARGPLGFTKIDDILHRYANYQPGDDKKSMPARQEDVAMYVNRQPAPSSDRYNDDL